MRPYLSVGSWVLLRCLGRLDTVSRWNERVYDAVKRIPRGRVATYGQIAEWLGRPRGGREVGWALSACDDPRVPCHRVVDRNGRLAPHFAAQRSRLRKEGIAAGETAVDLDTYRWRPTRAMQIRLGRVADGRFLDQPKLER